MRKHILSLVTLFSIVLLLGACGAQKKTSSVSSSGNSAASGPSASDWRSGVKGKWVLNSVTREDIPAAYTIKNIFDEAPVDCFIGSVWTLPGGNYRGNITFNTDGTLCANGAVRTIVWSIYNPKNTGEQPQFQFKKIYSGDKAANVTTGYRLDLSYTDGQELVMRLPIPLDNGTGFLVLNFSKLAE
ncbi:lipocalin family protein [Sphingobacterium hungaricum]